jgi:uncharacterized protein with FMN-binding domain
MNLKKSILSATFIFTAILISCKPAKVVKENIFVNEMQDGSYEGYSKHIDDAKVLVVIENKKIKEVKIIKYGASPFGRKAQDSIPLRIVEKQTPYVDAVSGATEGSNVIMNAAADALKKAMNINSK